VQYQLDFSTAWLAASFFGCSNGQSAGVEPLLIFEALL